MLNHEERLKSFLDSINRETQENYNKVLSEIEELNKKELSQAEEYAEKQAHDYLNKSIANSKSDANNKIAGELSAGRKKLSELRSKITAEVFDNAKKELTAFAESKDYDAFIEKSAQALYDLLGNGAKVYVKENDMKLAELISNAFNNDCTVLADNDIAIGGLKAQNADGTLIADDTLDTRLSQQYEWFLSSCNLSIELQ